MQAAHILKRRGVPITAARQAIDVGADVQANKNRRNTAKQRERCTAAKKRANRVQALVKACRKTKRMIRPAVSAVQDYGTVAIGMAPSVVKRAQSNIARAIGLASAGTPHHLAIEWTIGHEADPRSADPSHRCGNGAGYGKERNRR